MRNIVIFLLLVFLAGVCGFYTAHASSATTNSADSSIKPYIYVDGQVQKPGRYDWFPGMTVVDAINAAGGLKHSAGHRIVILHSDGSRIIYHGDTFPYGEKKPPLLKADDIVSVPIERPNQSQESN
jgi:protein involved in polysaccharide export with SLBB domain